jgi:hypothetical protein
MGVLRERQLHRIEFDRYTANVLPIVLSLEYVKQLTEF